MSVILYLRSYKWLLKWISNVRVCFMVKITTLYTTKVANNLSKVVSAMIIIPRIINEIFLKDKFIIRFLKSIIIWKKTKFRLLMQNLRYYMDVWSRLLRCHVLFLFKLILFFLQLIFWFISISSKTLKIYRYDT